MKHFLAPTHSRFVLLRRFASVVRGAFIALAALFLNQQSFAQCPFNVSGAGVPTAANDGLLFVRAAQGLRDSTLIAKVATSASPETIIASMANTEPRIDVNGSGEFDETDAVIIVRHLMGFREDALIPGGAGVGASRKTGAAIQSFIDGQCAATSLPTRKKLSVMKTEQMAQNNGGVFISVLDDVEIDQEGIDLAWLEIQGTLVCANQNLSLSSRWIIVHGGKFQCGTALNPFNKKLTLTLTGPSSNDVALGAGMGTKVLGVMHTGAQLKLFGENRKGWTQLGASVAAGATSITLKEAMPTWRADDKLVIAPSSFDAEDFDVVTITSVNGRTVNFAPALTKPHWGTLQTFDGKTLDQRAAVGLLSRNIVIQGDAQSETAKFGGHIMSMVNANVQMSGVELRKMGQRGRFGRYPMHWHLANDRANDFIRNSSIHSSFQRAVVVHGTNKVTVEDNVAFDITNHAYVWAEDGNEVGNKFLRNLAVFNKNPTEAEFAFPTSSTLHGNTTQSEFRSASFWGRSFNHTIVGNVAGGSVDGFGFFFDRFSPSTLGTSEGTGLVFEDNIAHSNYRPGAGGNAAEIYPEATFGHGLMVTSNLLEPTAHLFRRFTSYKNYGGAWLEDRVTHLQDAVLADNGTGIYVLRGVIDNATIIGKSQNSLGNDEIPPKGGFGNSRRGAINVPSSHGGARAPIVKSATIVNHNGVDDFAFNSDVGDLAYTAQFDNIRMVNSGGRYAIVETQWYEYDYTEHGVDDGRGALTGDGQPTTWVSRRSPTVTSACRADRAANAFACPQAGTVALRYENAPSRWTYLVETSGETLGMGQPWTFDAQVRHINSAWLKANTAYEVVRESNDAGNDIQLLLDAANGKSLELAWRANGAPSVFTQNGVAITATTSLSTMRAASNSQYFYDVATKKLSAKLLGGVSTQVFAMTAPFIVTGTTNNIGRTPQTPVPSLTAGFNVKRYSAAQANFLRQTIPSTTPASSTSSSATQLVSTSTAPLIPTGTNDTTVFTGYLNAPTTGLYRMSAPAISGHVDVFVGNVWVTGSYGNLWSVPGVPEVNTRDESGQVWLQAGVHPFTVVFGRNSVQTGDGNAPKFWLRWALPGTEAHIFPSVYR
jgi:hypothetical protein